MVAKKLTGTLKCPECGHKQRMAIPRDRCVMFYKCKGCGRTVFGKKRSTLCRCVFCSYADRQCPGTC